jgi:hypothetical protein
MFNRLLHVSAVSLTLLLCACGGGGGSSMSTSFLTVSIDLKIFATERTNYAPYDISYETEGSEWYTNGGQICSLPSRLYCAEPYRSHFSLVNPA